jgi:hypothetical protein
MFNKAVSKAKIIQHQMAKVKFTIELAMKAQRGSKGGLFSFFNLGSRWGWVVNYTPIALPPEKRPGTYFTGGWVGLRSGLRGCGKFRRYRDSIPGPSIRSQVIKSRR